MIIGIILLMYLYLALLIPIFFKNFQEDRNSFFPSGDIKIITSRGNDWLLAVN